MRVAQEGHITERFTRAVEQLGSERLEIRLGGIYALERLAKDSPQDHWTIMEVLTAFIRENAPWPLQAEGPPPPSPEGQEAAAAAAKPTTKSKPRTDIQAALTIIGRRRLWYGQGESEVWTLRTLTLESLI